MLFPLTISIENSVVAQPNWRLSLSKHLQFWRALCPHTPIWVFPDEVTADAIKATSTLAELIDEMSVDQPRSADFHMVLTARGENQPKIESESLQEVDFFSGQRIVVDIASRPEGERGREIHELTLDAFKALDSINEAYGAERNTQFTAADLQQHYETADALALAKLKNARSVHKNMFMAAGLFCIAVAVTAVAVQLPPLLMTLPVVVFWLLKLSAKFRQSMNWRIALLARSCAEMLRIRNAVAQIGISYTDILGMVPRQWRNVMMPTAIALRSCGNNDTQQDNKIKIDRFTAWVGEQREYYLAAIQREERIAKSTILTFDAAFTTLTAVATLAVAYSIAHPWLFPDSFNSAIVGIASAVGGCLSSLGLIAINFGRERASGQTVRDYRHMLGIFESMQVKKETSPPELVAEAIAEHASWCGRFLP